MTTNLILVMVGLISVAAVVLFAASRRQSRQISGVNDFESRWREVDAEAFNTLADPNEERYLLRNLPAAEFRRIQRERVVVMWEYLSRLSENTKLMVQAGQIVQHSSQGEKALQARQFVSKAIQTRMLIVSAQASLALKFVMPGTADPIQSLVRNYETLSQSFAQTWTQHNLTTSNSVGS
jgi:hypothetical protein